MNRRNYQRELERIIQKRGQSRPRVLLHCCCGPCSSAVLEYLTQYFDLTLLWYNPNIYPQEEFERRFQTLVVQLQVVIVPFVRFHLLVVQRSVDISALTSPSGSVSSPSSSSPKSSS